MNHQLACLFRIRGAINYNRINNFFQDTFKNFSFFYLNPRGLNIIRDSLMVPIVLLRKNSFN